MKKYTLVIILLFSFFYLIAYPVKITSWNIRHDIKILNTLNYSVDFVNRETQTIIVYVKNDNDFHSLLTHGFQAEEMPDLAIITAEKERNDGTRAYYTLDEYHTFMQNTAAQYPSICQLVQFGSTVQNRPLYFLKISDNVTLQENEPEFRYVSSMHGDEVVGFEMCIRLIQLLTSQYSSNTRISNIVNNTEIWICPMLNPDGYNAVSRYNGSGADLNRNFPMPTGTQHPDGMAWQPETIAIMNHGNANSINLSANFHGGALVANYPWDYTYTLAPDNNIFILAALEYANHNSPMHNSTEFNQGITNGADWYIAQGTLQDWVYFNNKCLDVTVELGNTKWPPSSQLDTYWSQNQESMLSYLEFVQKGLHGTVTNSLGQPLTATIHINTPGVDIKTDPDAGDYHRILSPGTYNVTASAEGYPSHTEEIVVPTSGSVTHNFVLSSQIITNFSGYLINSSGNAVANTNVMLIAASTNYEAMTNGQGYFNFPSIPEDEYTLRVSAQNNGIINTPFFLTTSNNRQNIIIPAPLFFEGFENGLSDWTVQSPWAIVNQSGNNVLTDSPSGNYTSLLTLNAKLTNPVSLSDITNPFLAFDIKYETEPGYDYLNVQISTDGTLWVTLQQFSGINLNWQTIYIPLSDYAGSDVRIRFQMRTDHSESYDGVYIDNVIISGIRTNAAMYGDIDNNLLMNLNDVNAVLQYSVGNNPIPLIDSSPWSAFRIEAADVDNDEIISATDAFYIYDKINLYNTAYPAQGGTNYIFSNPNLSFHLADNELITQTGNPLSLHSLSLSFSSPSGLSITAINWQLTDEQCFKAISNDNKSIGIVKKQNVAFPSVLFRFPYNTTGEIIHCSGLVNDIPMDIDINITSNTDYQIIPKVTHLESSYPNPFNSNTNIKFNLAKNDNLVKLIIFNVKGQEVKTLINSNFKSGVYSIKWDGTDNQNRLMGSGLYYCQLQTSTKTITRKMVMLK